MKKLTGFIIAFICCVVSYAQPWLQNLPPHESRKELTLRDYQEAFESYWQPFNVDKGHYLKNGIKVKAPGWKQFKRWEHNMKSKVHPHTGAFPKKTATEVYNTFLKKYPQQRSLNDGDWKPLGPTSSNSGYSGIGRINCIAFHPTDNNIFWVGAAAGGLWLTTNNGNSWTCLTENTGVLAISDIIIPMDYDMSSTIYIATGDRDGWDNRSIGVLKSTDGGITWEATGLTFSIYEAQMVNKIQMDPMNPMVLVAATTSGVYKTTDGGTNWSEQLSPVEFIDLEYKPTDFSTLYGSTKYGEIHMSANGGVTWQLVFDDDQATRIELAVSPNQPEWVYAVAGENSNGLYGIFKSYNSGNTFELVFHGIEKNLLTWDSNGQEGGGQSWYDLAMAASPHDANVVVVGGVNTWRSLDGGLSWALINHWWGDQVPAVHADKHMLRFRANGDLFECNDGGIYASYDLGTSWSDKTNGIQISQMYRLGVSQTHEAEIITGLQDNGSKFLSGTEWHDVIGGDGMECLIDYTDPNIQYGSLYFGQFFRTDNHWENSTGISPFEAGSGGWITPFIVDPINPATIYAGYENVWVSYNRGDWWEQYSFDFASIQLQSLAIPPSDNNSMYVSDGFTLWRTFNNGGNWINVTGELPVWEASIQYITVKHDDPNTVWVAMSGYTYGGVYESTDGGVTWNNISDGLPTIPAYSIVQNKLITTENHLYLGTELGVFFKNGEQPWTRFSDGLPNVEIGEIEIYYAADPKHAKLRAATYGRGLWESPIAFSSIPVSNLSEAKPICAGSSAVLILNSFIGSIQWQQSSDGVNWSDVTSGTGNNLDHFITEELSTTTYYRAQVIDLNDTIYSNPTEVIVLPIPDPAGFILGDVAVCQGEELVLYTTDTIANADTYVWTLLSGEIITSTAPELLLSFETNAQSGFIEVRGQNAACEGSHASFPVVVFPLPSAPTHSLTPASCESSTGSILLQGLPDGQWIVTLLNQGTDITGTGDSLSIAGLPPGDYNIVLQNEFGCTTSPMLVTFDEHPLSPPAPTITAFDQYLLSDTPDGNQWYLDDEPIPGANHQLHEALQNGEYYSIVTIDNCSSEKSNVLSIVLTATDNPLQQSIRLYPNPVHNELIIESNGGSDAIPLTIYNMLGQKMYSDVLIERHHINTVLFPNGAYLIRLQSPGESMKLFIKE